MPGQLFIVATPIGNLGDISERAKSTLASVDAVLCEDTRVTAKLMSVLGIKKTLISYHQHSSLKKTDEILQRLNNGDKLALVTDAGTPGISDPGGRLIEAVNAKLHDRIEMIPIPGPNAAIATLSISGFPTDKFTFLGFPPHKKKRTEFFTIVKNSVWTAVFYESTHRIIKTLEQLSEAIGDRPIVVGRELTKLHETIYRGTAAEVTKQLESTSIKGEFVIVIAPK
ncbi:16S rRNA (cytidine(1402)-2'-O)-methyltransferase [Patescibacteria group bacterium]|nr:16S rRNA (cytidine(1402)-2'-O)-methyltransferase [Patescibacteria group bacterium]MBU1705345.1 16S rRNA (cytidine(1402)-2'-O)-methyltransferase [Patescibacteria group bacterium]